jgi:glutamyl-tRNA reductase
MQNLLLVGTSHRFIEPSRLGLLPSGDQLRARLHEAQKQGRLAGFVVISTCNRLECYLELPCPPEQEGERNDAEPQDFAQELLPELFDIPGTTSQGEEVIRHLLRVAGSLDSMVLGENQILGQVKTAWQQAQDEGSCSSLLHEVFQHAVTGAKEVRNATGLGHKPVSVASLAARHLTQRWAQDTRPRIALLGAGEMVRKAVPALVEACGGKCDLLFVNRTAAKAEGLAREYAGRSMSLAEFVHEAPPCDALVVAVWSKSPILDPELAGRIAEHRRSSELPSEGPIELIDLGVPACIAPELGADDRFQLLDMDTLGAWSRRHATERRKAAARAMPIVERHVHACAARQRSRKLDLGGVRDAHLLLAEQQLRQLVDRQLAHLPDEDRERIERGFRDLAKAHAHLHLKDLRSMVAAHAG